MPSSFIPVVATEVFALRPDYCAVSIVADNLRSFDSHGVVDRYVEQTLSLSAPRPWTEHHLESWRAAYRAFGAKPQRTPCSADALLTRLRKTGRLPAVSAIVDLYNAVSTGYAIPVGGEDLAAYSGVARLLRASGAETFDTTQDGVQAREAVPHGEVVWTDELGVTCRRWNWRQGVRTRIGLQTQQAWFVLERLDPMPLDAAIEAAAVLVTNLRALSPAASFSTHLIDRAGTTAIS